MKQRTEQNKEFIFLFFSKIEKWKNEATNWWIRVPSRQSIFYFTLKIQNQNFSVLRFSNTSWKLKIIHFFVFRHKLEKWNNELTSVSYVIFPFFYLREKNRKMNSLFCSVHCSIFRPKLEKWKNSFDVYQFFIFLFFDLN